MATIQTILGDISADLLGFCQCHEHLMLSKGQSFSINSDLLLDDYDKSKSELLQYRNAGGASLIDAQPVGCNRMEVELASLSKETFINILASTGFHKLMFYPEDHWIHRMTADELSAVFSSELTRGMYVGTDLLPPSSRCNHKASIIKTAYDSEGLTSRYKRLFEAACSAAKDTGAPIMIHVENNTDPTILLDFMLDREISPNKLIFCHVDRACHDMEIMKTLLREGCFLEFDTIGRFKYHSDEVELSIIKALLIAGFENQILCSLDTTGARMKSYTPDAVGLDYILKVFVQKMKAAGIKDQQIHKIFHENCILALAR